MKDPYVQVFHTKIVIPCPPGKVIPSQAGHVFYISAMYCSHERLDVPLEFLIAGRNPVPFDPMFYPVVIFQEKPMVKIELCESIRVDEFVMWKLRRSTDGYVDANLLATGVLEIIVKL